MMMMMTMMTTKMTTATMMTKMTTTTMMTATSTTALMSDPDTPMLQLFAELRKKWPAERDKEVRKSRVFLIVSRL